VKIGSVELDLAAMQKRRAQIVKQSTLGIAGLFKGAGVTGLQGHGKLLSGNRVEFTGKDGKNEELTAKQGVLAPGSCTIELRSLPFDGKQIVDSWGALEFDAVPKRLGVIGAGVIGLELGSVWRRLRSEGIVLAAPGQFLLMADQQLAKEALRHFKKQGLDIRLGATVDGLDRGKDGQTLKYTDSSGAKTVTVDKVVVAIGRKPFTKDLLGEGTGVEFDERGFIKVDHECRTTASQVWAVGDVVRGPMLAHKGKEEGVMVADLVAGHVAEVNYKVIPSIIYTAPE